ncbi:MAG TPA: xanthine dehydrogenase family protein subunit M [Candidatus Limnocylindria bacterium]|nr:xanthine dehydrogenase family protein subunit M [Candidatus Limnocylindria bacterium]
MIPAAFDYARPASIDEALELLAAGDPSIRVLAGGQSIVPLMKLRLARPERLVDVGRLPELRGIRGAEDGGLVIGALTTWATLLADARVTSIGALADVLPQIGDVQVRNLGTIGGSLVHADPASDIAAPALALDVRLVARSAARGERTIPIAELFAGAFMTTLEPDELLTEIHIPRLAPGGASAYVALPQQASGYPIAGVAVVLGARTGGDGPPASIGIGVTGVGDQPYRATAVEEAILAGAVPADAVSTISAGQHVATDIHADREYRGAMAVVMARRALEACSARI